MNSEAIRRYAQEVARQVGRPTVYDSLGRRALYVASAPGVFFWGGEHAVLHGAPAVCQKVPLRVWAWISEQKNDGGPRIRLSPDPNDHIAYDPSANDWKGGFSPLRGEETSTFTEWDSVNEAMEYLNKWVAQLNPTRHFMLRTFHEISPGSGCNWSGAFAAATVACVMAATRELEPKDLERWSPDFVSSEQQSDGLVRFHRAAWKMESVLHEGRASGYGTLCSVVKTPGPVLYMTADRGLDNSRVPSNVGAQLDLLDDVPFAMKSLAALRADQHWDAAERPINYGLVYSGTPKGTGRAVRGTEQLTEDYEGALAGNLGKLLRGEELEFVRRDNQRLRQIAEGKVKPKDLRDEQVLSLGTSAVWIAGALLGLFEASESKDDSKAFEATRSLAEAMRRTQGGLSQLGLDRGLEGQDDITHVAAAIYRWARQRGCVRETAVKTTGGGRGGQLLFMAPKLQNVARTLQQSLQDVRTLLNNDSVGVTWTRDVDGLDTQGLRLEQCLQVGGTFE